MRSEAADDPHPAGHGSPADRTDGEDDGHGCSALRHCGEQLGDEVRDRIQRVSRSCRDQPHARSTATDAPALVLAVMEPYTAK